MVGRKHFVLSAVVLAYFGPCLAQATPERMPSERVDWANLSTEQQKALKAGSGAKEKQADQAAGASSLNTPTYTYQEGKRHNLELSGSGEQVSFRLSGSGSSLKHAGRVIIRLTHKKSLSQLNDNLASYGFVAGSTLDTDGLIWSAQGKPGTEGILHLNRLQESGVVQSVSPDWQRNFSKK